MKIFKAQPNDNFYHIVDYYDTSETHGHSYCGYYTPYSYNCITQEYKIKKNMEILLFNNEQLCPDCVSDAYACGKINITEVR